MSSNIMIGNTQLSDIKIGNIDITKVYIGDIVVYEKQTIVTELKPVLAWEFKGHTGNVNSVAVDKEGNVYSGSYDNTVRKISSEGTELWQFKGHTMYTVVVMTTQ